MGRLLKLPHYVILSSATNCSRLRLQHHFDYHQQQQQGQQQNLNNSSLSLIGLRDADADVRRLCNGSTLLDLSDAAEFYVNLDLAVNMLCLYVTPMLVLLGIVGNSLSFLVFSTTHLRRQSSSVYLASLACSGLVDQYTSAYLLVCQRSIHSL